MNTFTVFHVFHNDTKNHERRLKKIRENLNKIADPKRPDKFDDTFAAYTIFPTEEDSQKVKSSCLVGLSKDDILIVLPRNTEAGKPYIYPQSLALKLEPLLPTFSHNDVIQILKEIRAFSDKHFC